LADPADGIGKRAGQILRIGLLPLASRGHAHAARSIDLRAWLGGNGKSAGAVAVQLLAVVAPGTRLSNTATAAIPAA
jgi:hypothetical protein